MELGTGEKGNQKSGIINRVFLFIYIIILLLYIPIGFIFILVGTFFFDDPNASYLLFLFEFTLPVIICIIGIVLNNSIVKLLILLVLLYFYSPLLFTISK